MEFIKIQFCEIEIKTAHYPDRPACHATEYEKQREREPGEEWLEGRRKEKKVCKSNFPHVFLNFHEAENIMTFNLFR